MNDRDEDVGRVCVHDSDIRHGGLCMNEYKLDNPPTATGHLQSDQSCQAQHAIAVRDAARARSRGETQWDTSTKGTHTERTTVVKLAHERRCVFEFVDRGRHVDSVKRPWSRHTPSSVPGGKGDLRRGAE